MVILLSLFPYRVGGREKGERGRESGRGIKGERERERETVEGKLKEKRNRGSGRKTKMYKKEHWKKSREGSTERT